MASDIKDVFICHAHEDKKEVVRPLAEAFKAARISYWLDEAEIVWGDNIVKKVSEGLRTSRYVVVVLSSTFVAKNWGQLELETSLNEEATTGEVKVLPLLVGTTEEKKNILGQVPLLKSKLYLSWDDGAASIVEKLSARLRRNGPAAAAEGGKQPSAQPGEEARPDAQPQISCSVAHPQILPAKTKPPAWLRYKFVAFDLDGTLLKGYKFSWTLVWQHLGFKKEVQDDGIRRYRKGYFNYRQWCEWTCKLFVGKNLRREAFPEITKGATLTKNFYETMRMLKDEGIITAIVSGGVDTFIHEKIPDAEKWFDYVLINNFIFDEYGRLERIAVTDFDFAGKAEAIRLICQANGLSTDESVFVGDGYNDADAACTAGLCIAYPPASDGLDVVAHVRIEEDDLSLIIPHILKT